MLQGNAFLVLCNLLVLYMQYISGLVVILLVILVSAIVFFYIVITIIEPLYIYSFGKPIYVHFYLFPKKLNFSESTLLQVNFKFYSNLTEKKRTYFDHRVQKFINRYSFEGREGLQVTQEMKLKIAGTAIMLTFGMRNYLSGSYKTIVIYPDIYKSGNGNYHKGEFNPGQGEVVFSWAHFNESLIVKNDNLNLGIHEFTHVMHIDAVRKRAKASAAVYSDMFAKILHYLSDENNRQHLIAIGYLREYAYTNTHEFIAVILEHFFETPETFKKHLPELYEMIRIMINFNDK